MRDNDRSNYQQQTASIMAYQALLEYRTAGRGTTNITRDISEAVASSGIETGICHVFIHHTSASLILCENADPTVRSDLETFMVRLVPDGDPMFAHMDEGPDDMAAHVRSILTKMDLTIPVTNGRSAPGRGSISGNIAITDITGRSR